MFLMEPTNVPLYVYLNAFFSTIIQCVMGFQFYINSYKSLKHKSANMDVLVALGTTAAWGYGFAGIFVGYTNEEILDKEMFRMTVESHSHNFEISSALIMIIMLGKYLEAHSKKKTVDKLSQLASLKVTKANLIDLKPGHPLTLDTKEKEISVDLLQIGDLVKIYPG
jgi:P-type Cu+ transporter